MEIYWKQKTLKIIEDKLLNFQFLIKRKKLIKINKNKINNLFLMNNVLFLIKKLFKTIIFTLNKFLKNLF